MSEKNVPETIVNPPQNMSLDHRSVKRLNYSLLILLVSLLLGIFCAIWYFYHQMNMAYSQSVQRIEQHLSTFIQHMQKENAQMGISYENDLKKIQTEIQALQGSLQRNQVADPAGVGDKGNLSKFFALQKAAEKGGAYLNQLNSFLASVQTQFDLDLERDYPHFLKYAKEGLMAKNKMLTQVDTLKEKFRSKTTHAQKTLWGGIVIRQKGTSQSSLSSQLFEKIHEAIENDDYANALNLIPEGICQDQGIFCQKLSLLRQNLFGWWEFKKLKRLIIS